MKYLCHLSSDIMSIPSRLRKIGSPWRRGPGILRVPDGRLPIRRYKRNVFYFKFYVCNNHQADVNRVACIHYENKLKWRVFRHWQLIAIRMRIDRLLNEAIEMRYEKALVSRLFQRWRRRSLSSKSLRYVCGQVQSLRLNTFDAIWAQCRRFGQLNSKTAWLVFVVRFSQLKLCRRVLHIWRSRIKMD